MGNILTKIYQGSKFLSDWTDRLASVIGVLLVAGMTFSIILQVFFRYILRSALPWPEELSRYLMVWCAFVGASMAMKRGEHVGVTYFVERMPRLLGRTINLATKTAILYFLLMLVKYSWRIAQLGWRSRSGAMMLPMFYPRVGVTVGAVMLVIQMVYLILHELVGAAQEQEPQTMAKSHVL